MKIPLLPVLATFILVVQGCVTANTPPEIRGLGMRAQTGINQPYIQAASCVLLQIDKKVNALINSKLAINHSLQISRDGQYAEIIADQIIGDQPTISEQNVAGTYVIIIRPRGLNNSVAEIYVSNNFLFRGYIAVGLQQAASSCNR